ncbi:MAG: hypothetical protein MR270_03660 [Erysipelotrichaceae bacterium]|nr:hypothetical protein [Erysipelotrichaceae bacterium]
MKIYELEAIINKDTILHKNFVTREKANKYLEKILSEYNLNVEDIIYKNDVHHQEFVCNDYNRITINRVSL